MPSMIESILLGYRRRNSERSLRELDDRMLRDIGLTRHEVNQLGTRVHPNRTFGA
jgi:uncharacterized protein YjiS (DUF1127 family)